MSTNNGWPAFPQAHDDSGSAGMSLRDYFAAKAMAALVAGTFSAPTSPAAAAVAQEGGVGPYSYQIADSMLKAREA